MQSPAPAQDREAPFLRDAAIADEVSSAPPLFRLRPQQNAIPAEGRPKKPARDWHTPSAGQEISRPVEARPETPGSCVCEESVGVKTAKIGSGSPMGEIPADGESFDTAKDCGKASKPQA